MTHLTEQEARERYDRWIVARLMLENGFTPSDHAEADRRFKDVREAILREDPHRQALEEAAMAVDELPWADIAEAWADGDDDAYNRAMHAFAGLSVSLKAVQSTAVSTEVEG